MRHIQQRIREWLYEKLTLRMPPKGLNQFVCHGWRNLTPTLAATDRGAELDLRNRQDGESMSSVASGEGKQALRAKLIHIQLDQGARFEIVERQFSAPLPQNRSGQRLALDVDRMEVKILLR